MVAHAQSCYVRRIIIAWPPMPNGIQGQDTSPLLNPPAPPDGEWRHRLSHFPVAAHEAVPKPATKTSIFHAHPMAKPCFMVTRPGKLMVWGALPSP